MVFIAMAMGFTCEDYDALSLRIFICVVFGRFCQRPFLARFYDWYVQFMLLVGIGLRRTQNTVGSRSFKRDRLLKFTVVLQ